MIERRNRINQSHYVLLTAAAYQRIRALMEGEDFNVSEAYVALGDVAAREGWEDPEMSVYDNLEPRQEHS